VAFFGCRNKGPLLRSKSSGEAFLRFMGLMAVFGATAWLFWENSRSSMEHIEARGTLVDPGEVFSSEQRQTLRDLAKIFKSEYGIELKVHVDPRRAEPPDPDGKTLFISVDSRAGQVDIALPPLVAAALGSELIQGLRDKHLVPGFADGSWPQGLLNALQDMLRALYALQSARAEEYRFPVAPEPTSSQAGSPATTPPASAQ
jgi:hypothetical protein